MGEFRDGWMIWKLVVSGLGNLELGARSWGFKGQGNSQADAFAGNSITLFVPVSRFVADVGIFERLGYRRFWPFNLIDRSNPETRERDTASQQITHALGFENSPGIRKHNVILHDVP